jgi:predicted AlkP superfamily pyrophosphatase or phosphodiesterase
MPHFRTFVRALAILGLAGCAELEMAPVEEYPVAVRRVILLSLDGVRADALPYLPTVSSLTQRAVWTDAMETVVPALTLPAHLTMLSGRDVTDYGITVNTMDAGIAAVMRINGITPMFDWARSAGMRSAAVAGVLLVPPEQREEAKSFFGVDTLEGADGDSHALATASVALVRGDTTVRMLFVHFPDADFAGHTYGWIGGEGALTPAYRAALARMDTAIATLWAEVAPSVDAGHTAFLVTADHGGGHGDGCNTVETPTHTHCTSHPGDRLVPFVLVSRDAVTGRLAGTPSIAQVGATVGALLGIPVPQRAERAIELR